MYPAKLTPCAPQLTIQDAVKLTEYLPALPENLLKKYGGKYVKADQDWGEKVAIGRNGRLITGQNPASGA